MTKRALDDFINASTGLFKNNTAGDIGADDLRDFTETCYGGLFPKTAAETASFTGVVGTLHAVEVLTTNTANYLVTFPSTPAEGDRFGFYVRRQNTTDSGSGPFSVAPFYCVEPIATTKINRVTYPSNAADGSGKWGLWLDCELLIFRYVDSTIGWMVEVDRRFAQRIDVKQGTAITTNTANVTKNMDLDTAGEYDTAKCHDATAGNVEIKRAGNYGISVYGSPNSAIAATKAYKIGYGTVTATFTKYVGDRGATTSQGMQMSGSWGQALAAADNVWGMFRGEDTDVGCSAYAGEFCSMSVDERF